MFVKLRKQQRDFIHFFKKNSKKSNKPILDCRVDFLYSINYLLGAGYGDDDPADLNVKLKMLFVCMFVKNVKRWRQLILFHFI